jgi:hypothetical protein
MARECDRINIYLELSKVWVPDDPSVLDNSSPGHFEWAKQFSGGELKFSDPSSAVKADQAGGISRDTGSFAFDTSATVSSMMDSLQSAMKTAGGCS